jgi:hypothetical protein
MNWFDKNIKILLTIMIVAFLLFLFVKRYPSLMEPFTSYDGMIGRFLGGPYPIDLENAHGSAPAGVNASPGLPQYVQDSKQPHVNPMYKAGNPQNVFSEYKKQPNFTY